MTTHSKWRKSSRSQNTSSCVEVAGTLDQLRDSKNTAGPVLQVDVTALVTALRAGRIAG
jgi:hypothetical protein